MLQETLAHIEREAKKRGLHLTNILDTEHLEDAESSSLELLEENPKKQKQKQKVK